MDPSIYMLTLTALSTIIVQLRQLSQWQEAVALTGLGKQSLDY